MVRSAARTPDEYVASLPEDRRATIAEVRRVVGEHLPGEVVARADLEAYVERAKAAHSSLRGERRATG